MSRDRRTRLHSDQPIVHLNLFGQEVGADRGLVLVGKLFVDILVHQRRLADAAGSQTSAQTKTLHINVLWTMIHLQRCQTATSGVPASRNSVLRPRKACARMVGRLLPAKKHTDHGSDLLNPKRWLVKDWQAVNSLPAITQDDDLQQSPFPGRHF